MSWCYSIITRGLEDYFMSMTSRPFKYVLETSLRERELRSERTLREINNISDKLMSKYPKLAETPIKSITVEDCRKMLEETSASPLQFNKARIILHALFKCAMKHQWCSSNPIDSIEKKIVQEREVIPLTIKEIKRLTDTAKTKKFEVCMPALGLMLWAGIRPAEVSRLQWEDIDWQEKVIVMRSRHTKTGGCRHVTIHPVLMTWLKQIKNVKSKTGKICPSNWDKLWKELRRAAGFKKWQQDVLRHTYASYYIKYWHNLSRLQEEMGHRSSELLRTRYVSYRGITRASARQFWNFFKQDTKNKKNRKKPDPET